LTGFGCALQKKANAATNDPNRVTRLGEFSPAYWAIVFFWGGGQFFEKHRSSTNFGPLFSREKSYELIVTWNGFGRMLGNFFSQTHLVTLDPNNEKTLGVKAVSKFFG
jgi:hypothetical protein